MPLIGSLEKVASLVLRRKTLNLLTCREWQDNQEGMPGGSQKSGTERALLTSTLLSC